MSNMSKNTEKEKCVAIIDGLRKKVMAAFDDGKNVRLEIESELASYSVDEWTRCVPTGQETYTVTVPGVLHDEAIAIALERNRRDEAEAIALARNLSGAKGWASVPDD